MQLVLAWFVHDFVTCRRIPALRRVVRAADSGVSVENKYKNIIIMMK